MNIITFRIESFFADQIDELVTRGIFASRGELIRTALRELVIFTKQDMLFPSFEHSRKDELASDEKMKSITTKLTDNGLDELKRIVGETSKSQSIIIRTAISLYFANHSY